MEKKKKKNFPPQKKKKVRKKKWALDVPDTGGEARGGKN